MAGAPAAILGQKARNEELRMAEVRGGPLGSDGFVELPHHAWTAYLQCYVLHTSQNKPMLVYGLVILAFLFSSAKPKFT